MIESFLSCDWGTSRFRLRLIDVAGQRVLAESASEEGVASLSALPVDDRERRCAEILQRHIERILPPPGEPSGQMPIVISGMASSSIGWRELPYATLPFSLSGIDLPLSRLDPLAAQPMRTILLCSGVRGPRNVMRGEEVEVMGLDSLFPDLMKQPEDVWVILPGTHSKHMLIRDRSVVEFHTHLTGELFHLLAGRSSLRHSRDAEVNDAELGGAKTADQIARDAFVEGIELARRARLGEDLFQVRVGQLLRGHDARQSRSLLSGLLIGNEARSLLECRGRRSVIILCASEPMSWPYRTAFELLEGSQEVIALPPEDVARLSAWGQLKLLERVLRSS